MKPDAAQPEPQSDERLSARRAVSGTAQNWWRAMTVPERIRLSLEVIGLVAVVAAVAGLLIEFRARDEDRVNRAWMLVAEKVGVRSALEFLNRRNEDLGGLELDSLYLDGVQLPGARLDGARLPRTRLQYANLAGAELSSADLSEVSLGLADLRGAILVNTSLRNAVLFSANLSGADLRGADLAYANLIRANLTDANLQDANVQHADLRGANLSDANLAGALLYSADLTDVHNLTQPQIDQACGGPDTKMASGLKISSCE
jgi:hypothetical protein